MSSLENQPEMSPQERVRKAEESQAFLERQIELDEAKSPLQIEREKDSAWIEHELGEHEQQLEGRLTEEHFRARAARQAEHELIEQIQIDAQTGLANEASFRTWLEQAITQEGAEVWVGYIDLDYFKSINDKFGHQKGDEIISLVASKIIASRIREKQDMAAHPHGDEFIVGLNGVGRERIEAIADDILKSANSIGLTSDGNVVPIIGHGTEGIVPIQLSIGFVRHHKGQSAGQLLAEADKAMYEAKQAGRNRYVISSGPEPTQ